MIEKYFIKNPQSLKRWRRFKSKKTTVVACGVFILLVVVSLTAEFLAGSRPVFMSYKGVMYFPVFVNYHPADLNVPEHGSVVDYRRLKWSESDWALWPLGKWDPFESNTQVSSYPSPPSKDNWLGTDDRGRDIFARLVYGFRYSIGFAFFVWFLAYTLGTFLGAVMGFVGGRLDLWGQRGVEVVEAIPFLLLLITLVDILGGASLWLLVVFVALFRWVNISHYIRAEFLSLRKREFVDVCRVQGMSHFRIMLKHILPNALNPIVTFSPFSLAAAISFLTILDYLGFGLPPPTPSWGELLLQAEKHFTVAWWLAVFPSLALFTSLVSLFFIGEGVRNAFDSRSTLIKTT